MIYFLLAIVSVLLFLLGVILLIIGLSTTKPKMRNAGIIIAPICIVLLVLSVRGCTNNVANKIGNFGSRMKMSIDSAIEADKQERRLRNLAILKDTNRNSQINKLRTFINDETEAQIPDNFYTDVGTYVDKRAPLIYPFSVKETDYQWDVVNDYDSAQIAMNFVFNVRSLNYDSKYMLFETTGTLSSDERVYILFEIETRRSISYNTYKELMAGAKQKGYKNIKEGLIPIEEYYLMFKYNENGPEVTGEKLNLQKQIDSLQQLIEK